MSVETIETVTPELLSTRQAARLCGLGERTVWRHARTGVMPPPIKLGIGPRPAVRFRRGELLAWIADGCPRVDGGRQAGSSETAA